MKIEPLNQSPAPAEPEPQTTPATPQPEITPAATVEPPQEEVSPDPLTFVPPAAAAPAAEPATVPAASVYPTPTTSTYTPVDATSYQSAQASSDFSEAIILITGLASTISYILVLYWIKNLWATAISSAVLALLALFFAIRNYRRTGEMSPIAVIGISAATVTIVTMANYMVQYLMLRAAYSI